MSSPWVIRTRGDAINTTLFTAFSDEKWTIASIAGILCVRKDDFESLGSRTTPAARLDRAFFYTASNKFQKEQTRKIVETSFVFLWVPTDVLVSYVLPRTHSHRHNRWTGHARKRSCIKYRCPTQSPLLKRWDHGRRSHIYRLISIIALAPRPNTHT